MKKSLFLTTLMFSSIVFAEETCQLVNKEIARSQYALKNNQESLQGFQSNIQEMNNYTNGSVMKTVRWGIETSFLFSDRETKNMVKNFFTRRLLIDENYQLTQNLPLVIDLNPNLSVDQNLMNIKQSESSAIEIIETLAVTQSNEKTRTIQNEINFLLQEKDNENIRSFGHIALSVAGQEVQLAKYKVIIQTNQMKIRNLQALQKAKCL